MGRRLSAAPSAFCASFSLGASESAPTPGPAASAPPWGLQQSGVGQHTAEGEPGRTLADKQRRRPRTRGGKDSAGHGKVRVLLRDADDTLEPPTFPCHILDVILAPSPPRSYLLWNHTGQGPVGLGIWENSV